MSVSTRLSIAWPPSPPTETTDTLVLSFPGEYYIDLRPLKSYESLGWGIAGYSQSSETPEGRRHTKFVHIVDSRVPTDPLSANDEGLFQILENGDELETGEMVNPETGLPSAYVEIWRNLPASGGGFVLLESKGKTNKTFLGRIGNVFQGIGYVNGSIHARRLVLTHCKWEEKFVVGDAAVIPMIDEDDEWNVGDEVEFCGRLWKVLDKDSK